LRPQEREQQQSGRRNTKPGPAPRRDGAGPRRDQPEPNRRYTSTDSDVRKLPRYVRTLVATRELLTDPRKWTTVACAAGWDGEPEGGLFVQPGAGADAFSFGGALMFCGGMSEPEFPVLPHVKEAMESYLWTIRAKKWGEGIDHTERVGHAGMLETLDKTIVRVFARETTRLNKYRGRK
jgi:hypothetical protein